MTIVPPPACRVKFIFDEDFARNIAQFYGLGAVAAPVTIRVKGYDFAVDAGAPRAAARSLPRCAPAPRVRRTVARRIRHPASASRTTPSSSAVCRNDGVRPGTLTRQPRSLTTGTTIALRNQPIGDRLGRSPSGRCAMSTTLDSVDVVEPGLRRRHSWKSGVDALRVGWHRGKQLPRLNLQAVADARQGPQRRAGLPRLDLLPVPPVDACAVRGARPPRR